MPARKKFSQLNASTLCRDGAAGFGGDSAFPNGSVEITPSMLIGRRSDVVDVANAEHWPLQTANVLVSFFGAAMFWSFT
jgi:hypothetical protein